MRHIALLGSTGSIGQNALNIIEAYPKQFKVSALCAGENLTVLINQIKTFSPAMVSVKRKSDGEKIQKLFPKLKVSSGNGGLEDAVSLPDVDTVICAVNGTASLRAVLRSISMNHRICIASKEILVAAGELIHHALEGSDAEIVPVDSEQSAIFQCLGGHPDDLVKRLILTASGGPFFQLDRKEFDHITVKDAMAHPTWSMGTKITIDSATMMNKALEIIEAHFLFGFDSHQIGVVIHPQSVVHSMVEFVDSSVIAQLSMPDMQLPILYSLTFPERLPFSPPALDFSRLRELTFFDVDDEKFPAIRMAYDVLRAGGCAGAVFNAANEVAVDYFLKEKISFLDIYGIVEQMLGTEQVSFADTVEDIEEVIKKTKKDTADYIEGRITS